MKKELSIARNAFSVILTVAVLCASLPMSAFAMISSGIASAVAENITDSGAIESSAEISKHSYELKERREESLKHFRNPDGSISAVMFDTPVHVLGENGKWEDIDNTLHEGANEYATKDARIKFAKKTTGNESLFIIHDHDRKISMSLDGANKKVSGEITNYNLEPDADLITKLSNLNRLNSSIIYREILDGVDLEYITVSNSIKENIIINKHLDCYSFTFTLQLNNLYAKQTGNIIQIKGKDGKTVYSITPPFMYDANGEKSFSVSYTLSESGNGEYKINVSADDNWINAEGRKFPVTVDPSISQAHSGVLDLDLTQNFTDSSSETMFCGSEYYTYYKCALPNLPKYAHVTSVKLSLLKTDSYTNYIGVYKVLSDWDASLTYSQTVAPTNHRGKIGDSPLDYVMVVDAGRYEWDISEVVSDWNGYGICLKNLSGMVSDYPSTFASNDNTSAQKRPRMIFNYVDQLGIEDYWSFVSQSAGAAGSGGVNLANGNLVWSADLLSTTDSLMPLSLSLTYNSALGTTPYTIGKRSVPYDVQMAASGWKFNIQQSIMRQGIIDENGDSYDVYIYTDADGTEHTFLPDDDEDTDDYYDDSGLKLKLTVGTSSFVIEDRSYNKYTFSQNLEGGVLQSIEDSNGNLLSFEPDVLGRPTVVKMTPSGSSAITHLNIYYNSSGTVKYIIDPSAKRAVFFYYSNTYNGSLGNGYKTFLRKIIYAHGGSSVTSSNWESFYTSGTTTNITVDATCLYEYDSSSGLLISARDGLHQNEIHYSYTNGKVTGISEHAGQAGSLTQGQSLTLAYIQGQTTVTDTNGLHTHYVFDEFGRCISNYTTGNDYYTVYGAVAGEYVTDNEKAKNSLKYSSVMGSPAVNHIVNGGFEKNGEASLQGWTYTSGITTGAHRHEDTRYWAVLAPDAGQTLSIEQDRESRYGAHNLSLKYRALNADGLTLRLSAKDPVGDWTYASETIVLGGNTPEEISYAYLDFSEGSIYGSYRIDIEVIADNSAAENAAVWISDVAVTKGPGVAPFSRVEGGNPLGSLSSHWSTTSNVTSAYHSNLPFEYPITASSSPTQTSYASQSVYKASSYELGNESNLSSVYKNSRTYRLSGFAKADSIMNSGGSKYELRAVVTYSDDTTDTLTLPFNRYNTSWQFVSGAITTDNGKLIKDITVYCDYSYQVGNAYFDHIAFCYVSDDSVTEYAYNSDGMVGAARTGTYCESYVYSSSHKYQLSYLVNNKGVTDYEYDSNHRLIKESYSTHDGNYHPFTAMGTLNDKFVVTALNGITLQLTTNYSYNAYGLLTSTVATSAENAKTISTSSTYETTAGSKIFGALLTETDALCRTTRYYYDSTHGYLTEIKNPDGATGISYWYDALGRVDSIRPINFTGDSYVYGSGPYIMPVYDSKDQLNYISADTNSFSFGYDVFGNRTSVSDMISSLATYTYEANNGNLATMTYGNGQGYSYEYDQFDRLKKVLYNNGSCTYTTAYEYEYDSNGNLSKYVDSLSSKEYVYTYDINNRLIHTVEYGSDGVRDFGSSYSYDNEGRISSLRYIQGIPATSGSYTLNQSYSYSYDPQFADIDSLVATVGADDNYQINNSYDAFRRLSSKVYTFWSENTAWSSAELSYGYTSYGSSGTSAQVSSVTSKVNGIVQNGYNLVYDANGNISEVYNSSNVLIAKYYYDANAQLIREDNNTLGKTYVYGYDVGCNLISKKVYNYTTAATISASPIETITMDCGIMGDRINYYNSNPITYDGVGNPLVYFNGKDYTFTWSQGRRLASVAMPGEADLSFKYNDDGIRVSKTVGGVEYTYTLSGSTILSEKWTVSGVEHMLLFTYDDTGSIIGMSYRSSSYAADVFDHYYLERNHLGDIVAVYNLSGTKLVSYVYDAWGNVTTTYHNGGASTSAKYNPFRYRGYYYDVETGFYYLNARYYDPAACRFISMDDPLLLGATGTHLSFNLYTYCENNPVMLVDDYGTMWQFNPGMDPRNRVYGELKNHYGRRMPSFDSSSYSSFLIRSHVAASDALLLGYYYDGSISFTFNQSLYIVPGAVTVTDDMVSHGRGYKSFKEFKSAEGPAGLGKEWHHIVEQNQIKNSGFSPLIIHNTANMISIDAGIHHQISSYYSGKQDYTNGLTVRKWLTGQSFNEQYQHGIDILRKFGIY